MYQSIVDYCSQLPEELHFVEVPEYAKDGETLYRMLSDYGTGSARVVHFDENLLVILIADFTPKTTFEKVTAIEEEYLELSQFETENSSFKIGGRRLKHIESGIYCYVNTKKTTYTYCKAAQPTSFIKIILTKKYFDTFLKAHYGEDYDQSKGAIHYLLRNPNAPELNFVFQQIRNCQAEGKAKRLYLESKVMELLSLATRFSEEGKKNGHIPVTLDKNDIRSLNKTVIFMKNDLAAYPSGIQLAKIAGMSPARYQLAFRKHYGTTPYEYLKEMRLNYALFLLKNSEYDIRSISEKVGYRHSGHFARLFKNIYGLTPKEYRKVNGIK